MNPIHIKPSHKGLFTAKAKQLGMSVAQFASYVLNHTGKFDAATVKQANFARNFGHKDAESPALVKEKTFAKNFGAGK
jgi:hypothetical protein